MSVALLQKTLTECGIEPTELLLSKFARYFSLLAQWNQRMNLTSIVDEEGVYEKHFADSVLPLKNTDFAGKTILDIGSGGGFPGLVIALVCPSAKVTVLDATAKKFTFLREVCNELGLTNVSFVNGRIEERPVPTCGFDLAIARGFAALPIFLECAAPYVKVGGTVLAMKGASYQEEWEKAKAISKTLGLRLERVDLEQLPEAGCRANMVFVKEKPTPNRFPRRWDEIKRANQ